jgi:hypothetical protein
VPRTLLKIEGDEIVGWFKPQPAAAPATPWMKPKNTTTSATLCGDAGHDRIED